MVEMRRDDIMMAVVPVRLSRSCSVAVVFMILLHMVTIAGTDVVVTLSPPRLTVTEGGEAVFSCSPLIPTALPVLEQDGYIVTKRENPRVSFIDFETRSDSGGLHTGNRTYTLRDVSRKDNETVFRCTIAPFVSNLLTLNVVVLPIITGPSGTIHLLEHSTDVTTLDFSVYGVPSPTSFSWLHNGLPFNGNLQVSVQGYMKNRLVIREPTRVNSGNYTFVAVSSVGAGSLTLQLMVEYDEFLQIPHDVTVMAGAVVTMNCVHRFGRAYAWRSTTGRISTLDSKVQLSASGRTLYYGPVDYSDHALELFCIVHSETEQLYSSPLGTLTVQTPPLILAPGNLTVLAGSDIQLDFDIRGYPPALSVTYYYNGKELHLPSQDSRLYTARDDGGSLMIDRVSPSDAGEYTLVVENRLGEVCASIYLTVLYAPLITPLTTSSPVVVAVSSSFTLHCGGGEVSANPPPVFSWTFEDENSKPLRVQFGSRFILNTDTGDLILESDSQYSDSGVYTCIATNSIGSSRVSITVLVRDPPSPPSNIQTFQVGPTWALVQWNPPLSNGSFPLSMYSLSATPHPMEYWTTTSTGVSTAPVDVGTGGGDTVLERGFATNTACVEISCQVVRIEVKAEAERLVNLTGLVPAVNYSVIVSAFSNGSNLQSLPSDTVHFITDKNVPRVGSVSASVYGPGALLVNWTLAFSGGYPVLHFQLMYKKVNTTEWKTSAVGIQSDTNSAIPPDYRSWIVHGLEAEAFYMVRMSATNELGRGEYTKLPEPLLSHLIGVPGAPTQPRIDGWAESYVVLTTSLLKPGSQLETHVKVALLVNGSEIFSQHMSLPEGYISSTEFQVLFSNTSYRRDVQFQVFALNQYGVSEPSPLSLYAFENIQDISPPYSIAGPTVGSVMGAINLSILLISIALCTVMARESSRQRKSMARRIEMAQAADCPISPRSLLFIDARSSPDGRSRATPTLESLYAECLRMNDNDDIDNPIPPEAVIVCSQPTSAQISQV